ncbi:MAG: protein-L-isoaspartate(D-aspartate) O-methyltransferase [Acidobacteria bacterium]|nr:protein-L-isoaspartate(D-aspartate) O-methyltransferase [Acidobacteriota bacterium]
MVRRHVEDRGVRDRRVLEAMLKIPRHEFVPESMVQKAYGGSALPIGHGQTISQPYIVGRMIELLNLDGSEKVLEIGTGTGYQAAVLSQVAARVFSIEKINALALTAVEVIGNLGIQNVSIKTFDGTYGWSDQAPFDRIIVAAAAPEVPKPLVGQLSRAGCLLIPIGPHGSQRLARVTRTGTTIQIEDVETAEFVPLVGRFGWKG